MPERIQSRLLLRADGQLVVLSAVGAILAVQASGAVFHTSVRGPEKAKALSVQVNTNGAFCSEARSACLPLGEGVPVCPPGRRRGLPFPGC